MIVKINSDELRILKSSLENVEVVFPDLVALGVTVEEDSIYYYVSGPKASLYTLLFKLSFDYDIELL